MPLIQECIYQNPVAAALAPAPVAGAAPALAPAQGDHLFGDVVGTIETALQLIFGGGALWRNRMQTYNSTLRTIWDGLGTVDLGHGANPPIVQRNGAAEPDEHSHMFGGYSVRLQWNLCEVVCAGFVNQAETRRVGGSVRAWKSNVLSSFDDLMNHLVDSTALAFYIATPNQIRQANAGVVRHAPMSLANAIVFTNGHNGPGKARVARVLTAYGGLRSAVSGLLDRFDGAVRTFNVATGAWT